MGAVLSTFNSALNSAATIFSSDVYKRHIDKNASEKKLVFVGKIVSTLLAVTAIAAAPMVANAPDGLYQLLQQLNGIFFIPIGSILLAGFFLPKISALAARTSLFVGLGFYVTMTFILKVDLHFVHVWGIEFVLNLATMFLVSWFFPSVKRVQPITETKVRTDWWPGAKPFGVLLVILTIGIYVWLGIVGRG
jgi:SSS family solute:Na+ symporter